MTALGTAVVQFFERVAKRDAGELAALAANPEFQLEHSQWLFTLPDLHDHFRNRHAAFANIGYKAFRKVVFESPINLAVKSLGAEVAIADGAGKVDGNLYALVWRDTVGMEGRK